MNWTWNYFHYDRANRLVTDEIDPFDLPMIVSWDHARPPSEEGVSEEASQVAHAT